MFREYDGQDIIAFGHMTAAPGARCTNCGCMLYGSRLMGMMLADGRSILLCHVHAAEFATAQLEAAEVEGVSDNEN